jgi:hypothetical protein
MENIFPPTARHLSFSLILSAVVLIHRWIFPLPLPSSFSLPRSLLSLPPLLPATRVGLLRAELPGARPSPAELLPVSFLFLQLPSHGVPRAPPHHGARRPCSSAPPVRALPCPSPCSSSAHAPCSLRARPQLPLPGRRRVPCACSISLRAAPARPSPQRPTGAPWLAPALATTPEPVIPAVSPSRLGSNASELGPCVLPAVASMAPISDFCLVARCFPVSWSRPAASCQGCSCTHALVPLLAVGPTVSSSPTSVVLGSKYFMSEQRLRRPPLRRARRSGLALSICAVSVRQSVLPRSISYLPWRRAPSTLPTPLSLFRRLASMPVLT